MLSTIKTTDKRTNGRRLPLLVAMATATLLLLGLISVTSGVSIGSMNVLAEPHRAPSASPALQVPTNTVYVTADGKTQTFSLPVGTVETALLFAGVTLGEQDETSVALTEPLADRMVVRVDRVMYRERTELETVPYKTITQYSPSLKPGKTKVSQKGINGLTERVYREKLVDGKVVKTEKTHETVINKPVKEIVLKGRTKTASGTGWNGSVMSQSPYELELDAKGCPVGCTKVYSGSATAYTNDRGLCGQYTSTGRKAQVGVVAVDPSVIPYGTELYIVAKDGSFVYGYAIAGDTGGAMRAGHAIVDLFMDTYEECMSFGRRDVDMYVINS